MIKFKKIYISLIFIFLAGLLFGKLSGDIIISSTLKGNISIFNILFMPSKTLIDTYGFLNSSDDFTRLTGYYIYRESGFVDLDFLLERYKNEDDEIIKKTIIWTAEVCSNREKLVDFYKKLYTVSNDNLKQILNLKIDSY